MQKVTARDKRYFKDIKFKIKIIAVAHVICLLLAIPLYVYEIQSELSQIKSGWDSIYLLIISIATIGFGDIVPVTPQGKAIVVLAWFMTRMAMLAVLFVAASRILLGKKTNDLTKEERLYLVEQELKRVHALVAESNKDLSMHMKELRSDRAQRRKFYASSFTSLKDIASCSVSKVSVVECSFKLKDLASIQKSDLYLVYSSAKLNGIKSICFRDNTVDLSSEIV